MNAAICVWRAIVLTWVPARLGFHFYLRQFVSYNRTYGALGGFVILMLGTYVISFMVLVEAEINCQLGKMRAKAISKLIAQGMPPNGLDDCRDAKAWPSKMVAD